MALFQELLPQIDQFERLVETGGNASTSLSIVIAPESRVSRRDFQTRKLVSQTVHKGQWVVTAIHIGHQLVVEDHVMAEQCIISADSQVMEPANLWQERLDSNFRDQAPRVVKNEARAGYSFVAPGMTPFPAAGGFAVGKSGDELREHLNKGYAAARPSGWDPAERLKDQDLDGVAAEVLYTTLGMPLFRVPDFDLQRACFRIYNDWLAEFCAYNPKCPVGRALISLVNVADAVKELERSARHGLRGAMMPQSALTRKTT
jgi:hypothetical protein